MSEKCPSCGSDFDFRSSRAMPGFEGGWPYNQFKCYSVLDDNGFHQSERCRILELEAENIGWRTKCAAQEQDIQDLKLDVAAAREGHRFCNEAMLSAEARERELREACQAAIDLLTDMRTTIECYGDDLIAEQVIDQLKAAAPAEKDKP